MHGAVIVLAAALAQEPTPTPTPTPTGLIGDMQMSPGYQSGGTGGLGTGGGSGPGPEVLSQAIGSALSAVSAEGAAVQAAADVLMRALERLGERLAGAKAIQSRFVAGDDAERDWHLAQSELARLGGELGGAAAKVTAAVAAVKQASAPAYFITSPNEPWTPARARWGAGLSYGYWPFDDGVEGDGFGTGQVSVSADFAVTDTLALGLTAPFVVSAEDPRDPGMRGTGAADAALRARWSPRALAFGERAKIGIESQIRFDTGDPDEDRGTGTTLLRVDLKGVADTHLPRWPRAYGRLGIEGDFDEERELGSMEVVGGLLWGSRASARRSGQEADPTATALWVELASTFMDDEHVAANGDVVDDAIEGRLGVAYMWIPKVGEDGAARHTVSAELAKRLDEDGIRSSLSFMLAYRLTR